MTSLAHSPAPPGASPPGASPPGASPPAASPPAARRRHRRVLAVVALMLVPFAGVAVYLVLYQPFADAVGGCGGG
jgi:hypothetical protein